MEVLNLADYEKSEAGPELEAAQEPRQTLARSSIMD